MGSIIGAVPGIHTNNCLDIDASKIAEEVLSKLIESDPDILGVVKNLVKKKIDLISTEDLENPSEIIRNIFGFHLDADVIELMTRVGKIEEQLGLHSFSAYGVSIIQRLDRIEDEIERLKDDIEYLKEYHKYN